MRKASVLLAAVGAALFLGACSSSGTGGGGSGVTPSFPNNALAFTQQNRVSPTNAAVSQTAEAITVAVDGRSFTIGNGTASEDYSAIGLAGRDYSENGLSAETIHGSYATVALIEGDPNNRLNGWMIVDGTPTAANDIPNELASYTGVWALADDSGQEAYGYLFANADFANREMELLAADANASTSVGSGHATINGAGFQGSFETLATSGIAAQTNLNGSFFGPDAAELAGHLSGTSSGGNVAAGYIIGTKD